MYWIISEELNYRFEEYLSRSRCLGSTIYIDLDDISKYDDQLTLGVL